ncbi:structural maintenance of chromosomes protein 6 [Limosa lapponica baueri]|uniref:Structural maintenance of chromosomes protein 6 n=1 Tax=Limosa lapponica baueri TaxID=1758121 RepID=A0A2I0TCW0_LIMLA|nr:structural maintenance of chromosomes protein 6 [Limosa lapponica baueri]
MQFNRPPKNCREAFTAEGDQVFERRYYSSDYLRPKFLSKDVEAEISHLEKEIENKKAQITASHQHLRSIENEVKQNESHLRGHRQHQKELQVGCMFVVANDVRVRQWKIIHTIYKIKIRTTNAEIADLENTEEHQSVGIRTLEDEAEENKGKMESVKKEMQQQGRKMEELKNILQVAEKKFEEMREKIHQVEEIAGPIKDELNQADSEVENSKRRLQHYEDKQKEHLACIKRHKDLLAAKEKELEEKIAQAKQIYPERIEVSRTVKSLDAEMNRLRERINSENDRHGNREEIVQQFHDAKERYKAANSKVKNLKNFIGLLEEIMTQRFKIYRQFLRFCNSTAASVMDRPYWDTLGVHPFFLASVSYYPTPMNEAFVVTSLQKDRWSAFQCSPLSFIILFSRNCRISVLALIFVLFDLGFGGSAGMILIDSNDPENPSFCRWRSRMLVDKICLQNLMLAFWAPYMSN